MWDLMISVNSCVECFQNVYSDVQCFILFFDQTGLQSIKQLLVQTSGGRQKEFNKIRFRKFESKKLGGNDKQ